VLSKPGPQKELEALLGKARCLEKKRRFRDALEVLNQLVVTYDWFLPALTEKARLLMVLNDWDQAVEVAQRILEQDAQSIEALRLVALHLLTRESKYSASVRAIHELKGCIERHEPKNADLFFQTARALGRVGGRNPAVVAATIQLVERARQLAPEMAVYAVEFAYQQSLQGEWAQALQTYHTATQVRRQCTWCVLSVFSALSALSVLSVLSVRSALSALIVLSSGSVGSVGSVLSVGSVGSVGSVPAEPPGGVGAGSADLPCCYAGA